MKTILAIVLVFLIASPSFAVQVRRPSLATEKQITNLMKNKNSWSSILLNLAMLQAKTEGPLDQLLGAIQQVIEDLGRKLEAANQEFDRRTLEHENEVKRLNGAISVAQSDITSTTEYLNNVLYVQKAQLESDIAQLQANIEANKVYIQETTAQREADHVAYQERIVEHQEAIAAIDEALGILAQLHYGGSVSLIQSKKIANSLAQVNKKISKSKNVQTPLVKALVNLASSQFSDQDTLKKVEDLLIQVRKNLEESIVKEDSDEASNQAAFEADVANKEAEINQFSLSINTKTNELAVTVEKIEESLAFIQQREYDLAGYQKDLETENANYEAAVKAYEDLVAQFEKERQACEQALAILSNAEFAGYISDRVSQTSERIIDTQHGQGTPVASWTV